MSENSSEIVIRARFEDHASEGIGRLKQNAESLEELPALLSSADLAYVEAIASAEDFFGKFTAVWNSSVLEVRGGMESLISGAVEPLADALSALVVGGQFAAVAFGKAMLELSARAVLAIGQQAAVKALFALAEFLLFKDAASLAAAKLYGAVAATAIVVGAGLKGAASSLSAPSGGGSAAGGRSPRGSFAGSATSPEAQDERGVNITLVVNALDPASVRWEELVENHIGPSLESVIKRGSTNIQLQGT